MNEENKEPETPENTGEGDISKLAKETASANAAAERMEKAKEELDAATAQARLGGITEAGQVQEVKKEETALEYKDRIMSGKKVDG